MAKFFLVVTIFLFGLVVGFYIGVSSAKEIATLGATGIIVAIFGVVGTAIAGANLLIQWYREPKLEFGTASPNDAHEYHVPVKKTRGKGMAKDCAAYLTVNGTNVTDSATIWSLFGYRVVDIGDVGVHARLFKVVDNNIVLFPVANEHQGLYTENAYPLIQVIDSMLTLRLTSTSGNLPKPFRETIRKIMGTQ